MANLTRQERETVIIYNKPDDTPTVSTVSAVTKRKMAKLVEKDQNIRCVYNDGITATYELPKKQVCIRIAAKKRIIMQQERENRKLDKNCCYDAERIITNVEVRK